MLSDSSLSFHDFHEANVKNSAQSRADVAALVFIALMLAILLAPALAASNAQSKKFQCLDNMRDIAIALLNHHDVKRMFPLASTQPLDHVPGHAGEKPSGYSWHVMLLPFAENGSLYNRLSNEARSNKLTIPPFDPAVLKIDEGVSRAIMAESISHLICPSFIGESVVGAGAPEYAEYAANTRPSLTNYHATVGSHFMNTEGLGRMATQEQVRQGIAYEGNGVMPFPGWFGSQKLVKKGHNVRSIPDGTSNTLVFAESNERNYAAWIDGQTNWLVSAWPSNPDVPALQSLPGGQMELGWSSDQIPNNKVTLTAQKGVEARGEPPVYLPGGRWTGSVQRTWGASSNHPEGIGHAFADGHARMLSRDIDPVVYLHLTTRNGREPIDKDALE